MNEKKRFFLKAASASAAALAYPALGRAQDASRVARVVVGFPAGGSVDVVARTLGSQMQNSLGRTLVVENRAGAGGRIALTHLKTAPTDGSAILISPASMFTIYPSSFKELAYDPVADFKPVAAYMDVVSCFFVSGKAPVKTFEEYVSWVKKDPQSRAFFGSPAEGSMPHFLGMTVMQSAGLPINPIPYKGTAPLVSDAIGGHVMAGVVPLSEAIEGHMAGNLRVVAIGGTSRFERLPDVPTFQELGLKVTGGAEWYGVFLPAGASDAVADTYYDALSQAVKSKEVIDSFGPKAWVVNMRNGQALTAMIKEEKENWRQVLASLQYTPQ